MSYQTEERYWTDYVRVATPIVGLLLLLGVFWYWASSLIGSESSAPPPTIPAVVTVIAQDTPTPTPTPTKVATLAPETPAATATATVEVAKPSATTAVQIQPTTTPTASSVEQPTAQPPGGKNFARGQTVVVHVNDSVNMRSAPSLNGEIIEQLTDGKKLTVLDSQPQEANGFVWWHVRDEAKALEGWMVDDYLESS